MTDRKEDVGLGVSDQDEPSPYRRLAWRVLKFFLGFLLGATLTLIAAHYIRPKYVGVTKFQRENDPAAGLKRIQGDANSQPQEGAESFNVRKLTLAHDLAGQQAAEELVDQLGLTKGLARNQEGELTRDGELARQRLVDALRKDIGIEWEVRSPDLDLVAVTVVHADPRLAREICCSKAWHCWMRCAMRYWPGRRRSTSRAGWHPRSSAATSCWH